MAVAIDVNPLRRWGTMDTLNYHSCGVQGVLFAHKVRDAAWVVLAIMLVILARRSCRVGDDLSWQSQEVILSVQSSCGFIGIYTVWRVDGEFDNAQVRGYRHNTFAPDDLADIFVSPQFSHVVSGFVLTLARFDARRFGNLLVPYWSLVVLCLAVPFAAAGFRLHKENKRRKSNGQI